jgi:hypothetical protein
VTLAFGQANRRLPRRVAEAIAQTIKAPFAYVRRIVRELADPPSRDSTGPHLLLNALLRVAQVAVAGLGLLILAGGTALAVVLTLPDLEARRDLASSRYWRASLLATFLLFGVLVWIAGVAIESSWLTLRMANDLASLARRRARPQREADGTLLGLGAPECTVS